MLALTAAATDSAWNSGGSLLTFYFPIGLLILVVAFLYLQFARPHTIPGRKPLALAPTSAAATAPAKAATGSDGASAAGQQSGGTSNPGLDGPLPADTDEEPGAPKADA